ncbi:josephin-domain-containing protein [Moesziomyces antarcticus]|uniref:ubiquitinyl hydrolase 1 n=2 Tax=Pseudozyma antarctica TaxID=84753 RepID=A0A081CD86_PSEA2|nr:josephin-domain-containing protein [Moesziomyces antarcticus]GAK64632.1 josephin-domain-containing protein [Moesziomyces antarcticus]SPO45613.1 related to ataxin-3 [Moesziomyces antarcticus]
MSSSTPQQQLIAYIHHERQEPGSMLCAQHALNALLQGQYYDASQLAQIAAELDHLEASELGLSAADIASRDRSSLNMDDTGFFSASVLERALQVWGISISNWRSAEMRSRHNAPEQEKAFVLNLDSHWFTIRSFGSSSKFWYNLNSFLPEPSWIGNNYLGTLLHTAESEGYSVFVVQASEGSAGQGLRESDADQIADHLPPPGAAGSTASSATQALGLRPESNAKASSSSTLNTQMANNALGDFGFDDDEEDPELQAALRASLAQSPAASKDAPDTPSRSRVRPVRTATDDDFSGGNGSMIETDADIDAIAPSRRRHRAQMDDPVDDELRRAMEMSMSSSSHPSRTSSSSGHRAQAASSSSGPSSSSAANRPLGRRKRRAQERQSGLTQDEAIDLDDSREERGSSDYEELAPASLSHRSPFLSPAMVAANRNNEDVEEIMDDDENIPSDDEHVDPFSVPGAPEASALIGPRRDRHYDDEDAELQAALAASLGDTEAAARFATANPDYRHPLREEETQAVPEDVDRISRMREEARRKAREDEERQQRLARDEVDDESEAQASSSRKEAAKAAEDEDDEASEAEEVSAEEMRRRRLARFG